MQWLVELGVPVTTLVVGERMRLDHGVLKVRWRWHPEARGGWTHPRRPAVSNEEAMQSRSSFALIAIGAALVLILPACSSEEASPSSDVAPEAGPIVEREPACVPYGDGHERTCGLAPPRRRVQGGTAYKVTPIRGEGFWVVLPDELAPSSAVVAVPGVPIRVQAHLTTASPRDAADRYCGDLPRCAPVDVNREAVPGGVLTRWDDASGMVRDLGVTTVAFGPGCSSSRSWMPALPSGLPGD